MQPTETSSCGPRSGSIGSHQILRLGPASRRMTALLIASTLLSGCGNMLDRLENVNKPPPLATVVNPQEEPQYKPMTWPMPETPPAQKQYANSLWQPGARAFFRDGRAARVGDILRVNIKINDKAQLDNETEGKRDHSDKSAAPETLGIGKKLIHFIPGLQTNPADLVDVTANVDTKGKGTIKRQEIVTTQVAVLVTQLLPNGNMVIDGKQEIGVNNEVREVSVRGVIRPQDINSDNTIDSTQIAEARIVYGGRGQLSDVQRQRWGGQVMEILSPF